jgi:hypothetical protein
MVLKVALNKMIKHKKMFASTFDFLSSTAVDIL